MANGKKINFRVDDILATQMMSFNDVNWSAVARKAIEDRIRREKKLIESMQRGMMVIFAVSSALVLVNP
jgi:hypothetical protein